MSRQTCIVRAPSGNSEDPCPPPLRPERLLSSHVVDVVVVVAVVDVVLVVSAGRGSVVTPRSVVGLARGSEANPRDIILPVVVVAVVVVTLVVVPGLLVMQVVVAVAALRSMLEDRESLDEPLLDVPVVVVVVALGSLLGAIAVDV